MGSKKLRCSLFSLSLSFGAYFLQETLNLPVKENCGHLFILGSNLWWKRMPGKCGGKWIQLCSGNALRRRHQPERHLPGIKYKSQSFKRLIHKIPQGDSGGALTVDGILVGIVSRGGSERCIKVALISPDFILIWFLGQYVWCLHWCGLLYALDQRNDFEYGRQPQCRHQTHCPKNEIKIKSG